MYIINHFIVYKKYSMCSKIKQEVIFVDVDENGVVRTDWKEDKDGTFMLSDSYLRLGDEKKAKRCCDCGTYLEFKYYPSLKKRKLIGANFCKVRLCPMCTKRRSRKIYAQSYKVMQVASQKYEFIFLTLTQKNVSADELKEELDKVLYGFKKFMLKTEMKKAVKGWFRGLEITHNTDRKSKSYDTYHPHIHMILAVNKSYFTSRDYINQKRFRELWQESLGIDYEPMVNVKRFKASNQKEIEKSLAETSKYTVEKDDFLLEDDYEMTDKTVATLDKALAYRRLVAWGGVLKKIHKELNLDDAETGDLIKTDLEEEDLSGLEYYRECVGWHFGLSNYVYKNILLPEDEA